MLFMTSVKKSVYASMLFYKSLKLKILERF